MEFDVLRHHHGDKPYAPGDVREARKPDVAHLVANGVLRPKRAPVKKAAPRRAKSLPGAPENKVA